MRCLVFGVRRHFPARRRRHRRCRGAGTPSGGGSGSAARCGWGRCASGDATGSGPGTGGRVRCGWCAHWSGRGPTRAWWASQPKVGAPPARSAGKVVGVGVAAFGPVVDVVSLRPVAGAAAAGEGAAAVLGVEHDSLVGAAEAFAAAQIQRAAVVVEDREVVPGAAGRHADHLGHGDEGAAAGDGVAGGVLEVAARVRFPPPPLATAVLQGFRIGGRERFVFALQNGPHRVRELVDVPVRVDVAGR